MSRIADLRASPEKGVVADLARAYGTLFYAEHADASYRSAAAVVPLIMKLFAPESVVDVGCGVGTWLRAFAEQGVSRLLGIDGPHVEQAGLRIRASQFQAHDLRMPLE